MLEIARHSIRLCHGTDRFHDSIAFLTMHHINLEHASQQVGVGDRTALRFFSTESQIAKEARIRLRRFQFRLVLRGFSRYRPVFLVWFVRLFC